METTALLLTGLVALLHLYFLILEVFLWDRPYGLRVFGNTPEKAAATKVLALNQGVYNGFLVAGIVWGIWLGEAGFSIRIFFLCCVVVAGLVGGLTASRKILWVQAAPALLALAFSLSRV